VTYEIVFRCGALPFVKGCGAVITVRSDSTSYHVNGIKCPVCKQHRAAKVGER
jgi:hypothetical protein